MKKRIMLYVLCLMSAFTFANARQTTLWEQDFSTLQAGCSVSGANICNDNNSPKKGDVNLDGYVDISDVVAIINTIAGVTTESAATADVNGDKVVDISDVVLVINIIAGAVDDAVLEGFCPDIHHPHIIDLGDRGQWACCNVGASAPWEYGGYYAWGETAPKDGPYSWSTYTQCKGSSETCFYLGDDIAGTSFDAAQAVMGGMWCMPSYDQLLLISYYTKRDWTELNGVKGIQITGDNGKKLFLPGGGYKPDENYWDADRGYLYYLTSTLVPDKNGGNNQSAWCWHSRNTPDTKNMITMSHRCYGLNIRAIIGEPHPDNNPDDPAVVAGLCPNSYHPHVIDMGSAGKWSCCNVGAEGPWDSGGYYAWGETQTKDSYSWGNYKYGSKYLGRNIAATEYDVAATEWKGEWAMPAYRQFVALGDLQREWTTLNDVTGVRITASNGNSIFMPAAGLYWNGNDYAENVGGYGFYWSASLQKDDDRKAKCLGFTQYEWITTYWEGGQQVAMANPLYYGYPIRPVQGADKGDPEDREPDPAEKAHYCPDNNHPHVIDMGAGGKWACCNVGASGPWETGGYYCWGGTKELSFYGATPENETACIWDEDIDGNGTEWWGYKWGMWDDQGILLPKYDVARKKWGGSWHIPTTEQFEKLNDPSITLEATSLNGTLGLRITASNGNRIFLPYTGQKVERDFGYDLYTPLEYWTSSATSDFQDWCLVSDAHAEHNNYVYDPDVNGPPNDDYKSGFARVHKPRGVGLPVRAVQ